MQHSDDRPPASGRPSLLSAEQQGEADRQRILSGLETKPSLTTAGAHEARSGAIKWAAAGAAVLALTAGAGAWLVSEGEKEIVLAGTAPLPATPAPAAPLATEPVAAPPLAREEISTAAILQDTPVIADKPGTATPGAKPAEELKSLLEKGLPAVAKPAPPLVLADAPPYASKPAPAKAPAKPVKAAPAKAAPAKGSAPKAATRAPAANDDAQASNVQPRIATKTTKKTVAKADPKAKKKPAPSKDDEREESEVALLAALVAHSKATQPKPVNNHAAALKKCKTLGSAADAEQCRTKLCSGSAKNEAECKAARPAKPASDS